MAQRMHRSPIRTFSCARLLFATAPLFAAQPTHAQEMACVGFRDYECPRFKTASFPCSSGHCPRREAGIQENTRLCVGRGAPTLKK